MQDKTTTTIISLGTGGYIPTRFRETAAVLIRRGETALLIDAGTGVARLLEPEFRLHLVGVECLNVLLSHYHLDYVIGLIWMPTLWNTNLRLFCPSEPLVEANAEEALRRLSTPPLFGLPIERFPFVTEVFPFSHDQPLDIGCFTVRLLRQHHTGGSVGFRVDDCFAYITDTDPGQLHIPFLRGVEIAFMDAMYDTVDYEAAGGSVSNILDHGSNLGVATVAKQAGVTRLGLIHINPSYSEVRCQTMVEQARELLSCTSIPSDGEIIYV